MQFEQSGYRFVDSAILLVAIGFAIGGVLKGATGAGAPIVAIPVIALYRDVPTAVAIFVVPNLITNILQIWKYRSQSISINFLARFAGAGILGASLGTCFLAFLSGDALKLTVATAIITFIIFRIFRPDWSVNAQVAERVALPVGLAAGILQGASGISAPVSITFLNAMKLDRHQFIVTISGFFLSMLVVQVPLLIGFGYLTPERLYLGGAATIVLLIFMPIGALLGKLFSKESFNQAILIVLGLLALRLLADVLL